MRQMTSLWTSAKLKPALFRANTLHNWFFSEPPTVYWRKHVVSHYFRRSYLKTNEVSKSEGTRTVKYVYHFWNSDDAVDQKLPKLIHACRSYSLPKFARFLETQCRKLKTTHSNLVPLLQHLYDGLAHSVGSPFWHRNYLTWYIEIFLEWPK